MYISLGFWGPCPPLLMWPFSKLSDELTPSKNAGNISYLSGRLEVEIGWNGHKGNFQVVGNGYVLIMALGTVPVNEV